MEVNEPIISSILTNYRISRTKLDTSKSYIKVELIDGSEVETIIGQFIKVFTMGIDNMTLHWEFNLNGVTNIVDNEFVPEYKGVEMIWYKEYIEPSNSDATLQE